MNKLAFVSGLMGCAITSAYYHIPISQLQKNIKCLLKDRSKQE